MKGAIEIDNKQEAIMVIISIMETWNINYKELEY